MNLILQYKGLRRENYVLCFGRLVTALGSMVRPMLTMILSQKMGLNAQQVAWVVAMVGILSIPANLIGGKIADRFNKKMNIVYLDIVSVVCYVACAIIPISGKSIVLMFIASTCQSMESPSYNSLTADITVTADRERAYSLQYLTANLGGALASVVAGFLFRDYLWLAFLISGLSIGSSSILIFLFVKDISPEKDTGQDVIYQADRNGASLWTVMKENRLILLYILVASGYGAVYQMYNYLIPLDLVRMHGDGGAVIYGSVTSVNCLIVAVFTPIMTNLLMRFAEPVKTMFGYLLMIVGYAIFLVFAGNVPFYYVAMIILTWGEISNMLAESPYLTRRVPASHRGRIHGLMEVTRVGIMSGYQLVIGSIYKTNSPLVTWLVVLATCFGFLALTGLLTRKDRKVYKNLYKRL